MMYFSIGQIHYQILDESTSPSLIIIILGLWDKNRTSNIIY